MNKEFKFDYASNKRAAWILVNMFIYHGYGVVQRWQGPTYLVRFIDNYRVGGDI